jgi:hypothetical protein
LLFKLPRVVDLPGAHVAHDIRDWHHCDGPDSEILRYTFLLYREAPERLLVELPFAAFLPEPVLSGIRAKKPLALCLVSGYAIALHWVRKYLWVQGWGRWVMEGSREP